MRALRGEDKAWADAVAVVTAMLVDDGESVAKIGLDYGERPATLASNVAIVLLIASATAGHDPDELRDALQTGALAQARNDCRRRGTWTHVFDKPTRRRDSNS